MVSSFFLVITVGIYAYYRNQLLTVGNKKNYYARIMMHFAIALFLAFTILWIGQVVSLEDHPKLCPMIGRLLELVIYNQSRFIFYTDASNLC